MNYAQNTDLVSWDLRPNVSHQALYNMLESVMEISLALQNVGTPSRPGIETSTVVQAPLLISITRRISTSIRKILLDGNGSLLKRCVTEPNLHPLKPPYDTDPINFVRHFEEQRFTIGSADGVTRDIIMPAFDHTATVHPLYGVRHVDGMNFGLYNPFDHDTDPIKFQKWMSTRVFEIDGYGFNAEQVLRNISNKEGAHIEDNPPFLVPEDLNIGKDRNTLHRLANSVRFGGLTYLHTFSLFTGLYIVNRARAFLNKLPFASGNQAVEYLCNTIAQSPRSITTESSDIAIMSTPMAVLGHDLNLRGDYSSGITTTVSAGHLYA